MHDVNKINIMEDIHGVNDHIAEQVNHNLTHKGIFVVNEMGAPGIGKTSTLIGIINRLKNLKPYVIEGDIESDIDTVKLREMGVKSYQINTFGACHLDAPLIHNASNNIDFDGDGILFIENIGNLVCPAEFSIGEHIKLLICSVTEGSDKPYKYPLAFEKADIILINKVDLMDYVDFDEDFFMKGVRALNRNVPVFKVSAKTGEGFEEMTAWLEEQASRYIEAGKSHTHAHDHNHSGNHAHEYGHEHTHEHGHDVQIKVAHTHEK